MERTLIAKLKENLEQQVLLKGSIQNIRDLGKIMFLILRDRTGQVQIVIEDQALITDLRKLQPGSILKIEGKVSATNSTELGVEIHAPKLEVLQAVTEQWPLDLTKKEISANLETLLDHRPISLRHQRSQAIFKIQARMVQAYREFLIKEGFVEFFGPNIIGASSEGGTELFKVDYFDNEAMLSQSAQLYKQMMVGVYERVFALMKCFRAENSNTRRHLTEATQFEFEMGYIEDFTEIMDMLERIIKYIVEVINNDCAAELSVLGVELAKAPKDVAFPRVNFHDALELVFKRTGVDERGEMDLSPMAEAELCKYAREEHGTDFIFVPHFLRKKTAFYAKANEQNPEVTNYFDLLCREIEIASGGQRINDYDELVESLKLKGLDPEHFTDYLSIFKYGMPKHGGFGMGMERLTMMLLGLDNIRESTLFPSDPKRIAGVRISGKTFFGESLFPEILRRLRKNNIEFKHLEHKAASTSEESANIRGTKLEQGVKALILRSKKTGKNYMVCVRADLKLNLKLIEGIVGEKLEFESPEGIKDRYGLDLGAIPPFGNLLGLNVYITKNILEQEEIAFNAGTKSDSILMKSKDLVRMTQAELL
jgi:nondiscriminating aspartyl-tRNA synthetase